MTGPEDSHNSTRPISVAELLAKNGTIGAPPVGGRRRRRRGNSDAVTVAELTGEIPVVPADADADADQTATADDLADDSADDQPADDSADDQPADVTTPVSTDGGADTTAEPAVDDIEPAWEPDESARAEADYAAHLEAREADPYPIDFRPRRPNFSRVGAEEMSPDPLLDDDDLDDDDLIESDIDDDDTTTAAQAVEADELPSYLRSREDDALFGGPTVTDHVPRRNASPFFEDLDLEDEEELEKEPEAPESTMSTVVRGAWIVGQCIIAVAFGAGLFVAFDQLWKWNNIVALVLSVLVILGLVVGVRVVRKTEDIGSTLIAVAVGALVTLGPLALLQSG
jgi:hypothetical protein